MTAPAPARTTSPTRGRPAATALRKSATPPIPVTAPERVSTTSPPRARPAAIAPTSAPTPTAAMPRARASTMALSTKARPAAMQRPRSATPRIPVTGPAPARTTSPTRDPRAVTQQPKNATPRIPAMGLEHARTTWPRQARPAETRRPRNVTLQTPAMGPALARTISPRKGPPAETRVTNVPTPTRVMHRARVSMRVSNPPAPHAGTAPIRRALRRTHVTAAAAVPKTTQQTERSAAPRPTHVMPKRHAFLAHAVRISRRPTTRRATMRTRLPMENSAPRVSAAVPPRVAISIAETARRILSKTVTTATTPTATVAQHSASSKPFAATAK